MFFVGLLTLQIFRGASVTKPMGHKAQMHWWRLWVIAVTWRTACFALSVWWLHVASTIGWSDVCCSATKDLSFEECQLIPCYAWEHVNSGMLGGPRARASSSHQAQDQCQYPRPQYALSRCAWQFQSFILNLSHIAKCYRYRARSRVQSYFVGSILQNVYDFFVCYLFTAVQPAVPLPGGKLQEFAWTSKQLLSAIMPGRFASKKNEAPEVLHALSPCCDLEDAWSVCVSMLDSVLRKNVPRAAIPCPCSCWVPKDLNLSRCQAIPAFAWRELCLAQQWTKLKRVNFASRLGLLKVGYRLYGIVFQRVMAWLAWCCASMDLGCFLILADSSQQRCFDEHSKDADGSAELLEALSRCSGLEDSCTFLTSLAVAQMPREWSGRT